MLWEEAEGEGLQGEGRRWWGKAAEWGAAMLPLPLGWTLTSILSTRWTRGQVSSFELKAVGWWAEGLVLIFKWC